MANPSKSKASYNVARAQLKSRVYHQHKHMTAKDALFYKELKIQKAKMAVAKAGIRLAKAKAYNADIPSWFNFVYIEEVEFDNAVQRLNKLIGEHHENQEGIQQSTGIDKAVG